LKSEKRLVLELKTETQTIFSSQHFLPRKNSICTRCVNHFHGDFIEHDDPIRFTSALRVCIREEGRRPAFTLDLRLRGISQVKRNSDS
jgi:hypothetical protein